MRNSKGHWISDTTPVATKWNAGLRWEPIPSASAFSLRDSVLTITANLSDSVDLCTQYHDAAGGRYFRGAYFEARLSCTDWSAFWLFCANRPRVYANLIQASNPLSWTNEIDIIETDPGSPDASFCTLHANSSGDGGVPDELSEPHCFSINRPLLGQWHTYGLLWTQDQITWCVDNVKVVRAPPFPSTWQPTQLILTSASGGVNGSASIGGATCHTGSVGARVGEVKSEEKRPLWPSNIIGLLEEQIRSRFHYQYSNYQVEYSRNLIFACGRHMDQVFQALIDRSCSCWTCNQKKRPICLTWPRTYYLRCHALFRPYTSLF